MKNHSRRDVVRVLSNEGVAPPLWAEVLYYGLTAYGIMCVAWGISVRMLGAAGLVLLAGACLVWVRRAAAVLHAVAAPLLCAVTFMAIQVVFHGESWGGELGITFITWMLSVIILQTLTLRRGFLHRFALVCFAIGLLALPYMKLTQDGAGVYRAEVDGGVSIGNPNDLGAWLGFCSVYFITVSIETRRVAVRLFSWLLAILALLIVGLTVSRGPLLSIAIAAVVAFRRTLKNGFLPALLFVSLLWLAYGFGVFDQALGSYVARGTVESGRFETWPLAYRRIVESPLVGVGASHVATYVPFEDKKISPHNAFLFFPLASGVVPFCFFVACFARAGWRSIFRQSHPELRADEAVRLPLLLYLLLSCFSLDYPFMAQWGVATVCLGMSVVVSRPMIHSRQSSEAKAQSRAQQRTRYALGAR